MIMDENVWTYRWDIAQEKSVRFLDPESGPRIFTDFFIRYKQLENKTQFPAEV